MQNEEIIDSSEQVSRPPVEAAQPTPENPPWGVLPAIGVFIASVAFILLLPTIALLPYLAQHRELFTDNEALISFAKSDPMAVFLQIVAILPAHLLTVLIAWLVVTKGRRFNFREMLGWQSGGMRWWYFPLILILFFIVAGITSRFVSEQDNEMLRMLQTSRSAVYIVAFVATFTAPFVEEVVYRGVLYSAFRRWLGIPAAFLLVTLLFSAVHVPQYWPSYATIGLLTLLSLVLTGIRVFTKNLWPCIVLHTLFNGIQSIFLLIPEDSLKKDIPEQVSAIVHLLF